MGTNQGGPTGQHSRGAASGSVVGTIDNGTPVQCHDIIVFIPRDLLVCGAHDAGVILFDTSDPVHPVGLSHFDNPLVENHHSTTFSNDGNTLVLDDEVYTESCAGGTGQPSGALWFTTSRILALLRSAASSN